MIVVDTTVWIDFLEGRKTPQDLHLKTLIEATEPVALTDLVYCEVLQGILDDATYARTRALLRAYPILRVRGLGTFERTASIYRACRKAGITIRKTACLIAAVCLQTGSELYHHDRDFDAIARVEKLRIHRPRNT